MISWVQRHVTPSKPWKRWVAGGAGLAGLLIIGVLLHRMPHHTLPSRKPTPEPTSAQVVVSSGTIGVGGALSTSLTDAGLTSQQASTIERTLKPIFDPRRAKAIDRYVVVRSTSGQFVEAQFWPSAFDYYVVKPSTTGPWTANHIQLPLQDTLIGASGVLRSSLWDALRGQNVPPEIIYRFADIFSWRIDFLTEPRQGDTYKVVWKRRQVEGGAIRDDEIVAAYYNSKERGELYGYPLAGEYYDAEGHSLRGEFLRAPLNYRRISSRFTERRFHPILRIYRPHHGIDYSAAYGTPISAIGDGTVFEKGWGGGIGNSIRIRHSPRYVTIYGHMSSYAKGIHVGSHVHQGQIIGYVGSTGLSTGPHLHFGFELDGVLIDFFKLKLQSNHKEVPTPEHAHFEQIKKETSALFAQVPPAGTPAKTLTP